jgi:hypothetical protein
MLTTFYLKGGASFAVYLDEIKVNRSQTSGELTGMTWTPLEGVKERLLDININEVAAIVTTKERG